MTRTVGDEDFVRIGTKVGLREKSDDNAWNDWLWRVDEELSELDAARPLTMSFEQYQPVHHEDIRQLQHTLLDALELVARARLKQQQEGVHHRGDRDLGLTDAHGLDDHDVGSKGAAIIDQLGGRGRGSDDCDPADGC